MAVVDGSVSAVVGEIVRRNSAFVGGVDAVLAVVRVEVARQHVLSGVQGHSSALWYAILGEEFGEVGKAICEIALSKRGQFSEVNLRVGLIHTAAVAIAMAESLERCGFGGAA